MSILKSILHRWNKDSKSYDTLHPETEVAQITDFADGIVSKLAATTAISAISALQTDSWFGKMMKWVLDASGVKYLMDTNGYVCFGSLFGGLIIQWGIIGSSCRADVSITYPVAFSRVFNILHAAYVNSSNSSGRGLDVIKSYTTTRFMFYAGFDMSHQQFWLAVGV